jgi:hypothetical protein
METRSLLLSRAYDLLKTVPLVGKSAQTRQQT